jgi:hypothetical protein
MVEDMATAHVGYNRHFTLVGWVRPEQSPLEANGTEAHAWSTKQVNHHRLFDDDHVIIIIIIIVVVVVVSIHAFVSNNVVTKCLKLCDTNKCDVVKMVWLDKKMRCN